MERAVIFLLVVLALAQAGPLKTVSVDRQCAKTCTGNAKLNYKVGRTYNYRYEAEVQSSIFGAMEDYSGLHLSANIQMEILSKCELVMKLTGVTLSEYDQEDKIMKTAANDFKFGMEKNPIRLSFQDGNIEELCLLGQDPDWVVNAKRGIVSLFQNNMADFSKNETVKETDISGTCDTDYFVEESDWYTTNIGKSKKLHTCMDRHNFNSFLQGIPYTSNSEFQSMPIVKSEQNCQYKIDKQDRHITSVHCQESHMFRPFSREDSGAITKNDQKLTFIESTFGISKSGPAIQKVSLKFNHGDGEEQESKSQRDLTRKLTEICEKTKAGVRPETPHLFTELVYLVKAADANSLNTINAMLEKGTICKINNERASKFFLDTLPLAGTSAALNLMTKLLTTGAVTGIEADMWITSLSFIDKPDLMVLNEVKPLVNMKGFEEKTLLSVGTLIHSYCRNHGNCQGEKTVRALVSAIENRMAPRCKVTDANFKTTLMALRAIGNAGFAQSAVPTLDMCMRIKTNPIEIRLSAIEAFRRIPCTASRNALFDILKDVDEESEVRIAAYKSIMQCPTVETLNFVRKTLEKEEIKQVGSYIWSHLTNLMETSDRHKQGIKEILTDETLKKEFDFDMMKFSRNYEKSMFIEPLNTGAKVEGDLIWSPKSFMPRSSMLNLTVDLFGQSVNLLEFGGRVEGLEYFLEAFMGPNGYFSDVVGKKSQSNSLALKSVKPDKIKRIDRRFKSEVDELRASMYMRVFGNELRYSNFRGLDELLTGPDFNIFDFLTQLSKDNDYTFSHSTMFLDNSIVIPTGSGFPMSLSVNGTASVDLKMKGKMDLRNTDIVGFIKPSAAVDISSMMSVDAFVTKCGIKMVSTLHTSTAVQGKLHLNPSGTLTAEYEMPQDKMEVFDFKTSFFTVHRDLEKEQKMIEENRQTKKMCSPEKLVTITGLELCTEVFYPNASLRSSGPYFPLTGPVSGGLFLYNRDTHTKYTLEAKSVHTKVSNILRFTFDTPGSKIDRHMALNMNLNKNDLSLDMSFTSPWKKADFQGLVTSTKRVKGITGKLSMDKAKAYSIKAQVTMEINLKTSSRKYVPTLEIRAPGLKPIDVQATIQSKKLRFLSADFTMKGVFAQPLEATFEVKNAPLLKSLKGSLELQKDKRYSYESSLAITSYSKKRSYKPFISVRTPTAEVFAFGGNVNHIFGKKIDYRLVLDKAVTKKVSLKGNFRRLTYRRGRMLYGVTTDFTSGPMDVKLVSKIDNKNFKTVSTDISFTYNIRGVSRNSIKLLSKIINLSSSSLTKGKGSLNLNVNRNPEYNLKVTGNIDHNKKLSQVFTDINYGANFKDKKKQISFSFEMNKSFKTWMKAQGDVMTKFRFPAMNLNLVFSGKHSHSDRHLDTTVFLKGGRTFQVESDLHWKDSTGERIAMTGNYSLVYPGRNFLIKDSIIQRDDHTYELTMDIHPQKNQKHSMMTQLNVPSSGKSKWSILSDLTLQNQQPIQMAGTFDFNPSDFITKVSYERNSKKYAGSVISKTTHINSDFASDLMVDLEYPTRQFVFNINGQNLKDKYTGFADFKWDASNDSTKKVHGGFWLEKPTANKINGSASFSYPHRDLKFNLLHQVKAKYLTHADFQWEKDQTITADTTIDIKDKSIICTAKLATPFTRFPSLDMKMSHNEDAEQYLSKLNVNYHKSESVNVELKLKKPLTLKTFVGYFLTTTSMKGMKRFRIDFDHKLNPSTKIDSMVKFLWNKQQIQANFELKNITKAKKIGFEGDLTLKTTYAFMKKGILKLSHNNNGQNFNTEGSFQRNKKVYEFTSKITHAPAKFRYDSSGKIDMSAPFGSTSMTWDHRMTKNSIKSFINADWGKKNNQKIGLKFTGSTKDMAAALNLDTPFKSTGNLDIALGMNKESSPFTINVDVKKNTAELASASAFFDHSTENIEGRTSLRIPAFDIDSKLFSKYSVKKEGISSVFEVFITPAYTASLNSLFKKTTGFTHTVDFQSSFEGFERIFYTAELQKDSLNKFATKLEHGSDQLVDFQTSYLFHDRDNRVEFLLKTPYENMQNLGGSYSFVGTSDDFKADCSFEIVPLFKKKSWSLSVASNDGLKVKASVDTFVKKVPVITIDFTAQATKLVSDVSAKFEVDPERFLNFKFSHDFKSSEMKTMSGRITSPFTSYEARLDHTMRNKFFKSSITLDKDDRKYTGIVFQLRQTALTEGSIIISPPNRRDIEFHMNQDGPLTHFEMRHNRKHHFTYDMEIYTTPVYKVDVKSSWQLAFICPDDYDSKIMFEFLPRQRLATNGFFKKSSIGMSEFDFLFDVRKDVQGSFSIKSPLIKNIKGSFEHMEGKNFFESKGSLIHGGKEMFGGAATLSLDSSVVGDITVRSVFTKKIHANVRYDGQLDNFVVRTEGSYGKVDVNMEVLSKFHEFSQLLKVTFTGTHIKDTSLEISNEINKPSMTSFVEMNYGSDRHRFDMFMNLGMETSWSASLASPLVQPMSSAFSWFVKEHNWKGHIEFIRNTEHSEMNLAISTLPKTLASFDITSPYMKDIAVTLEHTSNLPNINSFLRVTVDKTDMYDARVTFENQPTMKGSLIITTPTDNVEGHLDHAGPANNFKSHAEFKVNSDNTILDLQFKSLKKLNVKLSLKSSFIPEELSFGFENSRSPKSFKTSAEYSYGLDRTEVDMSVDVARKFLATVNVKVPQRPKMTGIFKHTGELNDFNSHLEYIYGSERSFGEITFTAANTFIMSQFNLVSPYVKDVSFNMKHEGELRNFVSTGNMKFGEHKSEATIKVNLENAMETTFEVLSPSLTLNFTHHGTPDNFKSSFDLVNDMDRYTGMINLFVGGTVDLNVDFTSPIQDFETVSAHYSHSGSPQKFQCHAELNLPDGKSEGNLKVDVSDLTDMSLTLDLKPTSRFNLNPIQAAYKLSFIKDQKVSSMIEFNHGNDENKMEISFTVRPTVQGFFTLKSFLTPLVRAEFDMIQTPSNFRGNSRLTIDNTEKGHFTVSLNLGDKIEGSFSFKAPSDDMPKINGDISMEFKPVYVRDSYRFYVDDVKKGGLELTLDFDKKFVGSFEIDLFSDIYALDMSFTNTLSKYTGESAVKINDEKKAGFISSLDFENGMKAIMDMQLPVKNFSQIDLDFHFIGEMSNFDLKAFLKSETVEMINLVGKFTTAQKTSGDFFLESVANLPMSVKFDTEGSLKDFTFTGTLSSENEEVITSNMKFFLSEKPLITHGSFKINVMNLAYNLETDTDFFKAAAEISDATLRYAVDASFSNRDDTEGSIILTIPQEDPIKASFFQSFKSKRSVTRVEMELDKNNLYHCTMTFDKQQGLQGDFTLKTPLENFMLTNLNFEYTRAFPFMKSVVELNNNNKRLFKFSADIPQADSINGRISLQTAFEGYENVDLSFYHEGTWNNLKAGGKMIYSQGKEIKVDVEHTLHGNFLKSRFFFMSMYTDEIVITASHNGQPSDFTSKYELSMGKDNKFVLDTQFKFKVNTLDLTSSFTTTMSGVTSVQKVYFNLNENSDGFKSEASVESMGKVIRFDSSFQSQPVIEGSVKLTTPFESFEEMKASFSHSGKPRNFLTEFSIQYMPQHIISGEFKLMNNGWRKMDTTILFKTPFEGLEETTLTFNHRGDSNSFQCDPKLTIGSAVLSGTVKASKSPLSMSITAKTPFKGFKTLGFDSNIQFDKKGRFSTRVETSWGQRNQVIFDSSFSMINNKLEGSAFLTTPFEVVRRVSVEFSHQKMPTKFMDTFLTTFNGESLVDLEVDFNFHGDRKHFITLVRAPRPIKFEISGDFTPLCVDMDFLVNTNPFNMDDTVSRIKLEAGYDLRFSTKKADFKFTMPGHMITYKGDFSMARSTSDLTWGFTSAERAGFEFILNENDATLKVNVPGEHARVLEFNGSFKGGMFKTDFFWDAEVDRSKMFEFKALTDGRTSNLRCSVSLFVPNLQKTVRMRSDVSVFRGRVIFDGQLSFWLSNNEEKALVFMGNVEDLSAGKNSMNYSLMFGVSQPYTNIDVQMFSHVGKTNRRYSGEMGMKYMTAERQVKTFLTSGELDYQNNFMRFKMVNPLKTVDISGKVRRDNNQFQVTLVNKYDQKRPLNTEFTFNPNKRLIHFQTNYDLEDPMSELHFQAEYVNSTALRAEVFRRVDLNRITDILATTRLNTSHLLHSRLHWRPDIIKDLEAFYDAKMAVYKEKVKKAAFTSGEEILEELYAKSSAIHRMIEGEIGKQNMAVLEEVFGPTQFVIVEYVNRLILFVTTSANSTWNTYNNVMQKYQSMAEKTKEAMFSMQSPFIMPLPIEKPFDYAIEMAKLPAEHVPFQSAEAIKYAKYLLPDHVNTQIATMNENWELEENFKSTFEAALRIIEKEITKEIFRMRKFLMTVSVSPFTVYDPKHGEIQAEFFLPIPIKSLDVMPVVNFIRYFEMIKEKSKMFSVSVPKLSGEWLPPFTGVATVSQGRKFTTFDGFTYDLTSDCTFILTKDFQDGNFTIIRSNGENPSLTILSRNKPVEIKLTGEVFVGGQPVELPVKNEMFSVYQVDDRITVTSNDFTILFHLPTDLLTIHVNGWYFGKTGGLLGIYDNEPSNDLMTSFKKVIPSSNRVARTWEVGTATCR